MNTNAFVKTYVGKQVEYHSFNPNAKYQCVDLANEFIDKVLGCTPVIGIDAKDFPSKVKPSEFEVIKNTPEFIPRVNDIAVWNGKAGGGAGHIAIVRDSLATTSSFNSIDQNWSKPLYVTLETHDYTNVSYFLRPRVWIEDLEPDTTPNTYTEEEMTKMRLERDNNWNSYQAEVKLHEETKKQLEQARIDVKSRDEEIERRKKEASQIIEEFAQSLALPASADKITVSARLADLLKVEDVKTDLEKKLNQEEQKHDREVNDLIAQIDTFKKQIVDQNAQIDELKRQNNLFLTRLESFEAKAEGVQEKKEQINFLGYIFSLIKGKK